MKRVLAVALLLLSLAAATFADGPGCIPTSSSGCSTSASNTLQKP